MSIFMAVTIRDYNENNDARVVGILIAETYRKFNLQFASREEQEKLLGPFSHAWSEDPLHRQAIVHILRTDLIFVAEIDQQVVGVLRCRPGRLQSLFVLDNYHRQGIGRRLVRRCENELSIRGSRVIHLASTLYAVPFYLALGYKKSTGIRNGWSFEGYGLKYQPMRKVLV